MERSDPAMLSRLLELGVDPTENDAVGNPFKQTKKHKPKFSVAESMVWANYSNFVSWQIGPPDEKDFVRCFLMLLDHGAEFKPPPALLRETKFMLGNVQVSSIRLAPDDDERARPTALSNAARFTHSVALTPQPLPRQRKYLSGEFRPDLKLALARAAVAHDTKRLQSLREKGEKTQAGIDKRSRKAREKASTEGYALASDAIGEIWGGPSFRGPRAMTEEQLQVECQLYALELGMMDFDSLLDDALGMNPKDFVELDARPGLGGGGGGGGVGNGGGGEESRCTTPPPSTSPGTCVSPPGAGVLRRRRHGGVPLSPTLSPPRREGETAAGASSSDINGW